MDRYTELQVWQRYCVASLIGECESLLGKGILTEPAEKSIRLHVAETISAFHMQHHDERNAA
jgi:hypothetical protein